MACVQEGCLYTSQALICRTLFCTWLKWHNLIVLTLDFSWQFTVLAMQWSISPVTVMKMPNSLYHKLFYSFVICHGIGWVTRTTFWSVSNNHMNAHMYLVLTWLSFLFSWYWEDTWIESHNVESRRRRRSHQFPALLKSHVVVMDMDSCRGFGTRNLSPALYPKPLHKGQHLQSCGHGVF